MLTLPVWLCMCVCVFVCVCVCLTLSLSCLSPLSSLPSLLLPTGRVSLTRGASLLVERLTLEDEGWFECRILLLDSQKDDFRNGTWTFLSITGAALQGFLGGAAPFVAHHWHCLCLEQPQHGAWQTKCYYSSVSGRYCVTFCAHHDHVLFLSVSNMLWADVNIGAVFKE